MRGDSKKPAADLAHRSFAAQFGGQLGIGPVQLADIGDRKDGGVVLAVGQARAAHRCPEADPRRGPEIGIDPGLVVGADLDQQIVESGAVREQFAGGSGKFAERPQKVLTRAVDTQDLGIPQADDERGVEIERQHDLQRFSARDQLG